MTTALSSQTPRQTTRDAMNMPLPELLSGIAPAEQLADANDIHVRGVYDDSRQVQPGGLFIAVRGTNTDGREYVSEAIRRGACVVAGENLPPLRDTLTLNVPDARRALALLAARWFGLDRAPAADMQFIGVTGTNGKTTTAIMTRAILHAAGHRCGLLGTVRYDLCGRNLTAGMTTPGALELARCVSECAAAGATRLVLEVSSHALDQQRTAALRFAAGVFTNLSGDHLDYHGSFENYRAAKAKLFASLAPDAVAVLNRDDESAAALAENCRARIVWYALRQTADCTGAVSRDTIRGTYYRLRLAGEDLVLENALVGRHNVYNALAAASVAHALGAPLEAIDIGLSAVRNIPGRLQRVPCTSGADVFVDYAHTDDALRNVLSVLRPLTPQHLIVVFGCGGDRDRSKRPRMARAVAEYADSIYVTSDNPRTEPPQQIIDEILTGFEPEERRRVEVEPDRAAAIRCALAEAASGDVVLIAGKGHETYQILGDQRVHFDDVEVALQAAAALQQTARGSA